MFGGGEILFRLKKFLLFSALCSLLILAACNNTTEEKIHEHLEEAVQIEEDYEKEEDSIAELEQDEQEIYKEIIGLSMEDYDKIKELVEDANKNIDERTELIQLEDESYEESKNEFVKIENLIKKLNDSDVKEKAEEMYDTMMERYSAYDELHDAYVTILEKEKELYIIFEDKEAEQTELTEHLDNLNESYGVVIEVNDRFNEQTEKYNELKKEFYNATDLDVEYQSNDKAKGTE